MSSEEVFYETEIGIIPEDWNIDKLDNLTKKIATGTTPPSTVREYVKNGVNFVRSSNVFDFYLDRKKVIKINKESIRFLKNSEVKSGDVLLNITGDGVTFLRDCIVPDGILPAYTNQSIAIIRTNERINSRYLSYYLSLGQIKKYMEAFNSGSARRTLAAKHVREFLVPFPSMEEQIKISDIINSINEKIELNKQMNQTLEEIAQAIFRQWFVYFEFLDKQGRPYKSNGGEMVNSELGRIPKGWELKNIEELTLKMNQGVNTTTENIKYSQSGIPVIRAKNIFENDIAYFDLAYVDNKTFSRIKEANKPKKYDILYTNIGSHFGNAAIVATEKPFTIAWNVLRLQPDKTIINSEYLCFLLNEPNNKFRIKSYNSSSTMPFVSGKEFAKIKFILPTFDEQEKITEIIKSLNCKIELNKSQNKNLIKLRDSLLPKLMSGKIRVKSVEGATAK